MASDEGSEEASEFTVPVLAATAPHSEPSPHQAKPDSRAARPLRVLVVDDNEDLARGLAKLLEIHGHHVRVAYDGPSGVDQAKEWHPEIVLLDIGLPGMDGFQVASLLRQNEGTRNAVIIAISGYGQEEDRNRSKQAGFDHHLVKPINSDELAKMMASPR